MRCGQLRDTSNILWNSKQTRTCAHTQENHINWNCNGRQNPPKAGQTDINNENIVFLYLFAGSLPDQ